MSTGPADTRDEDIARLRNERDAALGALRAAIRDTTRLTRLFAILTESAPPDKTLDLILATLSELFIADVVALLRPSGEGEYAPVAAVGWPARLMGHTLVDQPDGPIRTALRDRMPVVPPDTGEPGQVDSFLADLGVTTTVWLPVIGTHAAQGVLLLARCRPAPFRRADVDLVTTMAYRIGLMLDRVQLDGERVAMQQRLRQTEKAEGLSRMAGAVAHHFNNMLAVIGGSLELVLNDLPPGHPSRADLARAADACTRAGETSGLMLTYLGQQSAQRVPVDLAATTREVLDAFRPSLPAGTSLVVDLPERGLIVLADRSQLSQVVNHLGINAREALDASGGCIRVSASVVPVEQLGAIRAVCGEWMTVTDAYVRLEVSDSGCGMDEETLARVFDPFFTTKSIGRGLGLPAVQGIVRAHGGAVTIRSAPGTGTSIQVFWPLHARLDGATRPPASAGRPVASARPLVLVVDDEDLVREMVARMLKRLGYEVLTARDGLEGLEVFRAHAADVSVAVLDVTMPKLDGWATLKAIRAVRPDIPAVLASGYDEAQVLSDTHTERPQVFLHKPFVLAALQAAVEKAITGRHAVAE
jgi:signal transduction histidine kinase/CheY-like chemotaxis protein